MEDRQEYRGAMGVAAWWPKDGTWHIAVRESGRDGFFWTAQQFRTRQDAINALEGNQ